MARLPAPVRSPASWVPFLPGRRGRTSRVSSPRLRRSSEAADRDGSRGQSIRGERAGRPAAGAVRSARDPSGPLPPRPERGARSRTIFLLSIGLHSIGAAAPGAPPGIRPAVEPFPDGACRVPLGRPRAQPAVPPGPCTRVSMRGTGRQRGRSDPNAARFDRPAEILRTLLVDRGPGSRTSSARRRSPSPGVRELTGVVPAPCGASSGRLAGGEPRYRRDPVQCGGVRAGVRTGIAVPSGESAGRLTLAAGRRARTRPRDRRAGRARAGPARPRPGPRRRCACRPRARPRAYNRRPPGSPPGPVHQ